MPAIECKGLGKIYPAALGRAKVEGLRDLSMTVEESEVFGFLGPNGAGKTTTIKILTGLQSATTGEARILGKPAGHVEAKRLLGFLPEHPYFYDHLTGREILVYFGRLFGLRGAALTKRVDMLLERVSMTRAADQRLRSYSKGMLQRIGIAQALINDPPLVILDEPMSGLDPIGRKEVRDIILELRAEKRTVFFSTHILSDVEVVCDRIAILHQGRLVTLARLHELVELAGNQIEIVVGGLPAAGIEEIRRAATVTESSGRVVVRTVLDDAGRVLELCRKHGATVLALAPVRRTLEEIFMDKIGGPARDREPVQL